MTDHCQQCDRLYSTLVNDSCPRCTEDSSPYIDRDDLPDGCVECTMCELVYNRGVEGSCPYCEDDDDA